MKYLLYDKSTGQIRGVLNGMTEGRALAQVGSDDQGVIHVDDIPSDTRQWCVIDGVLQPRIVPDDEKRKIVQRHIRTRRFTLLQRSDWTQTVDAPVSKRAWAEYRQALRDMPTLYENETEVANIVWPTPPGK